MRPQLSVQKQNKNLTNVYFCIIFYCNILLLMWPHLRVAM